MRNCVPFFIRIARNFIKMADIDTNHVALYNQNDIDQLVSAAVSNALQQYEMKRSNLDNGIHQNELLMLSTEKDSNMNHRQKITINGETQWRTFGSIQELVDLVAEAAKTGVAPSKNKKKKPKVKDYLMSWFETYKAAKMGENYRINCMCMINKHILPVIGEKYVSDIAVADVQKIMSNLKSASSGKQVKCIINMMIDAAIADEIYTRPNPCKDKRITMPTAKTEREGLSNDDLSKLIETLPTLPAEHSRMLVILIMTGCRRGEALGIRWEDIDWKNKTIHLQRVVRFVNNRPIVSEKMKSKAANRTVSIWDEFIPYLGEKQESGFIINCNGDPLSEKQYMNRWNAIVKLLQKAGIENRFTAHQLRHTYATVAANSGNVPPKVLQGMLGHSNFQTTMNIYAGIDKDKVRESSHQLHGEYAKLSNKSCSKVADKNNAQTIVE